MVGIFAIVSQTENRCIGNNVAGCHGERCARANGSANMDAAPKRSGCAGARRDKNAMPRRRQCLVAVGRVCARAGIETTFYGLFKRDLKLTERAETVSLSSFFFSRNFRSSRTEFMNASKSFARHACDLPPKALNYPLRK